MKDSFVLYTQQYEAVEDLSLEQKGLLFDGLFKYVQTGDAPVFEDKEVRIAFKFIRLQIDRDGQKYDEACEKKRAAIKKRWSKGKNTDEYNSIDMNTNLYKSIHNDNDNVNVTDNDNEHKVTNVTMDANNNKKSFAKKSAAVDVPKFIEYFNSVLARHGAIIKPVQSVTDQRRAAVEARARENGKASLQTVAMKAAKSNFLNGENDRSWLATFDWLMRPSNFAKVLEGNFDNDATAKAGDKKVNELWK